MDEDSESTAESENSSDSPPSFIPYNSYVHVTKCKKRKKLRPPKLKRKVSQRPIPSDVRIKTKQIALEFDVTEEEPQISHRNSENVSTTPEKRKSPVVTASPRHHRDNSHRDNSHRDNSHRQLALVTYSPRYIRHNENWEDEEWENMSEEDNFSDYHNEEENDTDYQHHHNDEADDSLDEDFAGELN